MQNVITIAERHGPLIVFLNVLLSQGGLPLPAVPTLMTVAALARQSPYQISQIMFAGVSGALLAELALYWCGLHSGSSSGVTGTSEATSLRWGRFDSMSRH
jgi:membrane protein DedA with SNARE-associated domain